MDPSCLCRAKGDSGTSRAKATWRVSFTEGPDAIIRFPKPGCTVFPDEKVTNEARVIEFIRENTTIPVPRLISWGVTEDSPQQLGPFLISDYVHGVSLSSILRDPADNDWQFLNPTLDDKTLNSVYEQIADMMLQLFQFNFSKIGAISKDPGSNKWSVAARPLTYTMNELATAALFPLSKFPTTCFNSTKDYFRSLANANMTHLETQRNIATDQTMAEELYIARHGLLQLVDKYCTADNDRGPFKLFCDDLRPHNILVDPETLRITAFIDLEFTNAMPSQYSSDPPWWLLLAEPESYLSLGRKPEEFVTAYEAYLDRFLQVLQRVEKGRGLQLSSLMRDAWETKRFWFNYAIRNPFEVETLCVNYLGEASGAGKPSLDDKARAEMEQFVQMKMEQLEAYDADCKMLL
ncbi:hypothetical protein G6O67_003221 [Ophiocordyceps sinensis]|uniref:Aminoglycoside phosphotransferase domain-containing protein n=1 Tax=Ophiocordyceps sinensis TaxID=72228 RepID=A0A8H4PVU7_9HYPO|nr:hypothetical protein G6O67_003221 [Ophiocordyceps sinensis]